MRHTDMSLFVTNKFLTTYENWNRKEKFRTEWVEILSEWLHFLIFMLPLLKTHWQVWTLFTSCHKRYENIKILRAVLDFPTKQYNHFGPSLAVLFNRQYKTAPTIWCFQLSYGNRWDPCQCLSCRTHRHHIADFPGH